MNPTYLLAWIPERLLNEKGQTEWDKFVKIEERNIIEDEDEGSSTAFCTVLLINLTLNSQMSS